MGQVVFVLVGLQEMAQHHGLVEDNTLLVNMRGRQQEYVCVFKPQTFSLVTFSVLLTTEVRKHGKIEQKKHSCHYFRDFMTLTF